MPTLVLPARALEEITQCALDAYPEEACGLVIGHRAGRSDWRATSLRPSRNLAKHRTREFEVDPALRLQMQRELRGSGEEIIGHYHSHPDGRAEPSARDLQAAWEDQMIWIVAAVDGEGPGAVEAYIFMAGQNAFLPLVLRAE